MIKKKTLCCSDHIYSISSKFLYFFRCIQLCVFSEVRKAPTFSYIEFFTYKHKPPINLLTVWHWLTESSKSRFSEINCWKFFWFRCNQSELCEIRFSHYFFFSYRSIFWSTEIRSRKKNKSNFDQKKNQTQWFIRIATFDFTSFRRLKSLENYVKTNVQNQTII